MIPALLRATAEAAAIAAFIFTLAVWAIILGDV